MHPVGREGGALFAEADSWCREPSLWLLEMESFEVWQLEALAELERAFAKGLLALGGLVMGAAAVGEGLAEGTPSL